MEGFPLFVCLFDITQQRWREFLFTEESTRRMMRRLSHLNKSGCKKRLRNARREQTTQKKVTFVPLLAKWPALHLAMMILMQQSEWFCLPVLRKRIVLGVALLQWQRGICIL